VVTEFENTHSLTHTHTLTAIVLTESLGFMFRIDVFSGSNTVAGTRYPD